MLIKAPIGSGKSFLFFDGPIYGLYKYSSRNMLNTKSTEGYVKCIIEINDIQYLIVRNIKKSKVKESCESKLYILSGDLSNIEQKNPLIQDSDIEEIIKTDKSITYEEVIFKNETDLQQNLQNVLPPREVIMNTIFLMQDSDNIFELTPIERLTILKNVFNLMGIDEAKEILADKKKDIRYKIKSKTDLSSYDKKLQNKVQEYLSTFETTEQILWENIDTKLYKNYFEERKMIADKLTIKEFSLKDFPDARETWLQTYIDIQKEQIQKIQHQLETIQQNIKDEQQKLKEIQTTEKELSKTISELNIKIADIDEKKIEAAKKQKKDVTENMLSYETALPKKTIREYIKKTGGDHIFAEADITIANVYLEIQGLINKGKIMSESIKHIQAQIQNEELSTKNEAEKVKTQAKHLEEKISIQEDQLKNIKKTLGDMEKNIETQAKFACEKIKWDCPFIKVINSKNFEQLEAQKATIINQQDQTEKIIKQLTAELKSLTTAEVKQDTSKQEALKKEQKNTETTIESIKAFLSDIGYKAIEQSYSEYMAKEKKLRQLDEQISTMEQESKKAEDRKLQLQKAMIQKESIGKQSTERIQVIADKEQEWKTKEQEKEKSNHTILLQTEQYHLSMKQLHHDIQSLIDEFKEHQWEVQKLQEQETILGDLYTIFSKELLLRVLQDHLPVINDIVNTYLAQIVEYHIDLHLNKSNADKLELEAKIIDNKGERDTKSLSWGQRVILKLVRMLAISSYINSPILFLDETINNLDTDTVGKVADVLENFVKQRSMKFYTITHSQQIQQMDIRDQTIELSM